MNNLMESLDSKKIEYENIEIIFNNIFSDLQSKNIFKNKDLILMFHLGGLINDTIYRQQKYFSTKGLLKKIVPFLNYIGFAQIHSIFNLCNTLQKNIAKRERKKTSFLREKINMLISEIKKEDFISRQEDLVLFFIAGYNIYNACWNLILKNTSPDKIDYSSVILDILSNILLQKELDKISKKQESIEKKSFIFGYLVGGYFFRTVNKQVKKLKTQSLLKTIHPFLKDISIYNIKKFIQKIDKVIVKISSLRSKEEKDVNVVYLLNSDLHMIIWNYIFVQPFDLQIVSFALGFWLVLTKMDLSFKEYYDQKFNLNNLSNESVEKQNEIKNKKITITDYLKYIKDFSESDNILRMSFIIGIFLNRISYKEEKILSSSRLKKATPLIMRHLDYKGLKNLLWEIIYTYLSCWVKMKMQSNKSFSILPELRIELISAYIDVEVSSVSEAEIFIHLIKGYHCPRKLSWQK